MIFLFISILVTIILTNFSITKKLFYAYLDVCTVEIMNETRTNHLTWQWQ
jgi:hypothetical protein